MSNLVYIEKLPAAIRSAFEQKVITIANYLQVEPNWLMQVMKSESGLNPQARNKQEGRVIAVGLIQFIKPTAEGLGTSMDAIYKMTATQQLDYVQKYFAPYRGKMKSYYDVYLVTFFPAGIGKPDSWIFQTSRLSAALIAKQNPIINRNKDGKITIGEFKEYVLSTVPASLRNQIFTIGFASAGIVLLLVGVFF